jgi:hypothetical protein
LPDGGFHFFVLDDPDTSPPGQLASDAFSMCLGKLPLPGRGIQLHQRQYSNTNLPAHFRRNAGRQIQKTDQS